jgi:hypothetical protein
MNAANRLRRPG